MLSWNVPFDPLESLPSMTKLPALLAVLALVGCAIPLTEHNATSVTAASPVSVEQTYRNVLSVIEVCYPALHTVESNYFPEAKEGVISLSTANEYSRVWFFKMKVAAINGRTVMSMQRRSNFPDFGGAMPAWAIGDEGGCPYGNKHDPKPPTYNRM